MYSLLLFILLAFYHGIKDVRNVAYKIFPLSNISAIRAIFSTRGSKILATGSLVEVKCLATAVA